MVCLKINNILHVKGLRVNLISISQVKLDCDFYERRVSDHKSTRRIRVRRRKFDDNCYKLACQQEICYVKFVVGNVELWHQKLDHINHKLLEALSSTKVAKGLPLIKAVSTTIVAHVSKRSRSRHHIKGSGKKYILFCADDYSCFTWIEFLREKFDAFILLETCVSDCKEKKTWH